MDLPYGTEGEWEKAEGQFEHKGEMYRIVKHKFNLGSVFIACVKDSETTRINQQLEDFAQTFSDKPVDAKQNTKSVPSFIKEYISNVVSVKPSVVGWSLEVAHFQAPQSLVPSFSSSIVHPPERIS